MIFLESAPFYTFFAADVVQNMSPNWTLIVQGVFFLISYWALSRWFFPPVMEVLTQRQKKVERALEELKRYEREGKELEEKYRQRLAEARSEAQGIYSQARQEASERERELLQEARQKALSALAKKREENRKLREEWQKNLDTDADSLAHEIAEKLLERSIN